MFSKREWIIFLIGAEFFHTISHILIMFNGALPIQFYGLTITRTFNFWAIIFNALICILLYWWLEKN